MASEDPVYKGHLLDLVKSINAGTTEKRAMDDHGISLKRLPTLTTDDQHCRMSVERDTPPSLQDKWPSRGDVSIHVI